MSTATMEPGTDLKPLQQEINSVVITARDLVVNNQESLALASTYVRDCNERIKRINDTFDPIVSKAHAAHKEAVAQKKKHLDPVELAKKTISGKVSQYQIEQDRIRLEAERVAREAAQKEMEERKLAEATELQAAGMAQEAEAVLEQERPIEIVKAPEAPKVEGLSFRENWTFEVVDESLVPNEYKTINTQAIGAVVRSLKANCKIPGVRVYTTKTTIVK